VNKEKNSAIDSRQNMLPMASAVVTYILTFLSLFTALHQCHRPHAASARIKHDQQQQFQYHACIHAEHTMPSAKAQHWSYTLLFANVPGRLAQRHMTTHCCRVAAHTQVPKHEGQQLLANMLDIVQGVYKVEYDTSCPFAHDARSRMTPSTYCREAVILHASLCDDEATALHTVGRSEFVLGLQ